MRADAKKYLAIDLEMSVVRDLKYIKRTGLRNEIIQIGAVILDGKFNIVSTFSEYVHPEHSRLDRYIRELTGITADKLKDAPNLYDALKAMSDWLGEEPISVISWGKTDLNQLKKEVRHKRISIKNINNLFSKWTDFQKDFSNRVGVKRQFSLGSALEMAGIEPEGRAHDGLTDAYNMAKLYGYLKKNPKQKIFLKKIITITLNPALDKTIYLDELQPGKLHRLENITKDPGGKGINVSKTLRAMGVESTATGFLGGNIGEDIVRALRKKAIVCDFVDTENETRCNTKIMEADGRLTELNESGAMVSEHLVTALKEKIKFLAEKETLFVFSGSIPPGVDASIYKECIEIVHKCGGKAILDADGEAFRIGLEAKPDYIKPNVFELEKYVGHPIGNDPKEIKKVAKELLKSGVKNVAVTAGEDGAFFFSKKSSLKVSPLSVEVVSTVGAGDAFVSGMAIGWIRGMNEREMVEYSTALSAACVTTEGTNPAGRELVESLVAKISMEKI